MWHRQQKKLKAAMESAMKRIVLNPVLKFQKHFPTLIKPFAVTAHFCALESVFTLNVQVQGC